MPDTVIDRPLPHNVEAERSVLGAILIDNAAFNSATELIRPEHFYRDAHRRIFERMVTLNERRLAIDLVTLKEELARAGELEEVGGPAYIASLVDGVPRATNVEHYARIVKEKAILRGLIQSATRIMASAYDGQEDTDFILDSAERDIFAIAEDRVRAGFVGVHEVVTTSFKAIEQLYERKELVTGVPSGFVDLDSLTAGFQASDLIIIAGRPSMGKTAFVLNIAEHVGVKTDRTVGIFSLEMARDQLVLRLLCSEGRVDAHKLRSGFLGEKDWGRIAHAIGVLSESRIFIDDTPAIGVMEMRAKARRLAAEHGLGLLVVDYIQLMQARGRFENRTQELASISRALKGLAKELSVPIVALSQLSRAPESRGDHRPQLSDLRESGALEQDADVVLFIYRPEVYEQTPENEGRAEVIIGKQRNGPLGSVQLAFLKQYTRFENLDLQQP